jgi:cephalosporin hydroxylase
MNHNLDPDEHKITEAYHKWYYNTEIWKSTTFMGVLCQKSVSDMWNYQEIISDLKPSLVLEFGTCSGGSALFFSTVLQRVKRKSKVLSIDVDHQEVSSLVRKNSHIELLNCSSVDLKVSRRIKALRKKYSGSVFAILDSDHHKAHVLAEMELLRPLLRKGDYLIVEDSNINGHPVLAEFGEGPMEAILEYLRKYPQDYEWDFRRENKFGFTFAPRGFLIRQ